MCVYMCVYINVYMYVVFTRMLDIKDLAKPTGGEHCDYYWIRNENSCDDCIRKMDSGGGIGLIFE